MSMSRKDGPNKVKSLRIVLFLALFGSLAVSFAVSADTIILTDGKRYHGEITAEEDDRVQIKLEGGGARLWFPRDQISSIESTQEEKQKIADENVASSTSPADEDDDRKRAQQLLEQMRKQSKELSPSRQNKKPEEIDPPGKNPEVKADAVEENPEIVDALVDEMRNAASPFKRIKACKKLGEVGGERAIPHLIHALDDKTPTMRKAAIGSLKKITGTDLKYNPTAPRAVRLDFIKKWEDWWKEKQDKEGLEQLKSSLF